MSGGEPAIFTLVGAPVLGELGEDTRTVEYPECEVCRRRPPTEVTFLEYRFDYWSGEDLVTAMGEYAVSDRLRSALERAEIRGVAFEPMSVTTADEFEIDLDAYGDQLPAFHRLVVTGRARGPEIWWVSEYCDACDRIGWLPTEEGIDAKTAYLRGEVGAPREVFEDSWQGDDVFVLDDPGPPELTARAARVLDEVGVKGVTLHPARWV